MVQAEVILALFLGMALLASMVSRKVRTPYTTLLVLVGLGLTLVPSTLASSLTSAFSSLVGSGLFLGLVLPPLLFESIMSVRPTDFRAVYRPAISMATVGVVISTLVVGVVLWKVVGLSPLVSFPFAALISPTDVATVLEIFARISVPARLATLVEMESVFNDASGIAILQVILTTSVAASFQLLNAVGDFGRILGGGALVGLGIAYGARQLQKHTSDVVTQVTLTLVTVYGAYALATVIHASGLIAVAMTGVFYGNSMTLTLNDKKVAEATHEFWKVLAFVANAVAFFYIGVSTNIYLLATATGAILIAYAVVVMARITSVYPILSLSRVAGSAIPVPWINVATLGGMRGALAIVLVSAIPEGPVQESVATLTFGVVILSVLLQGPLLGRFAGRTFGRQETLEVTSEPEEKGDREEKDEGQEELKGEEAGEDAGEEPKNEGEGGRGEGGGAETGPQDDQLLFPAPAETPVDAVR